MGKRPNHNFERECETKVGEIRVKRGLTLQELAQKAQCSMQNVWELSWGRTAPVYLAGKRKGLVKGVAQRICDALCVDPSEAFPLYVCGVDFRPEDDEGAAELLYGDWSVDASRDPAEVCENREFAQLLCVSMTKKEVLSLVMSASGNGLLEIGESLGGVSQERARQVMKKAIRKAVTRKHIIAKQERQQRCRYALTIQP